ncbi:hypothetical protein [Sphingobacterium hotanense]|uniref:hypothetical protein n=1 Tax=Sphingobacterium hotanense TaxID=649196 RepID=UPI0021A51A0C|nr:hypothetical protein [Sphingobacterium hotanense]MCT1526909.1 hypothetical protein [Sphingobacterium hotanense]
MVKHLAGISEYSDNNLRLRIVIELLKGKLEDTRKTCPLKIRIVTFKIQGTTTLTHRLFNANLADRVANWLPSMLEVARFADIAPLFSVRGKGSKKIVQKTLSKAW